MRRAIALIVLGWTVAAVAVAGEPERMGLAWQPKVSPDGASLLYLAEHRVGKRSDYTLTLMTGLERGTSPELTQSLTPRYGTAVQEPSGDAIAYRATDFALHSPVHIYDPTTPWGHPYVALSLTAGSLGDVIQWSQDGEYLRTKIRRRSWRRRFRWRLFHRLRGMIPPPEWDDYADTEWVESVEPARLPAFMTQAQPSVTLGSPVVWGEDSLTVYVGDKDGVWCATIGKPFMHTWDLIHPAEHVQAMGMSPSGACLVVEYGQEDERHIDELHLGSDGLDARHVDMGWGVTFGHAEDMYYYATFRELYVVDVGGEPRTVRWTSYEANGF